MVLLKMGLNMGEIMLRVKERLSSISTKELSIIQDALCKITRGD